MTLPFVVRAVQPVLIELDREVEEAAASLGASNLVTFRRIILPALLPAILSGAGLAFTRAIGEYGSVVLIGGGIPRRTEVASQYIQKQIEIDRFVNAAAVSVTLLHHRVRRRCFAPARPGQPGRPPRGGRGVVTLSRPVRLSLRTVALGYLGDPRAAPDRADPLPHVRGRLHRLLGVDHDARGDLRAVAVAHRSWRSSCP